MLSGLPGVGSIPAPATNFLSSKTPVFSNKNRGFSLTFCRKSVESFTRILRAVVFEVAVANNVFIWSAARKNAQGYNSNQYQRQDFLRSHLCFLLADVFSGFCKELPRNHFVYTILFGKMLMLLFYASLTYALW